MSDKLPGSWNHRHRMGQTADDATVGVFNPHHCTVALHLRGSLDIDALNAAWRSLQVRHPVLRSGFSDDGTIWYNGRADPEDLRVIAGDGGDGDLDTLTAACAEPFDLAEGPVARMLLLDRGPDEAYFALVAEHMVADGWSLNVLLRDLGRLYRARRDGMPPQLPELTTTFSDFVAAQNAYVDSPAGRAALDRMARRVAAVGPNPVMPIEGFRPCDRPRYERLQRFPRRIDASLRARLEAVARPRRLSALNLMHAALHQTLHERSGADVVSTTLSTANRVTPGSENTVGWFASKTIVVSRPGEHATSDAFLKHFRSQMLAALDDSDLPWPALIASMDPPSLGRQSRVPYVTFNAQPLVMSTRVGVAAGLPGVTASQLPVAVGWHDASIATFWNEDADGVTAYLYFKTDWYDEPSVVALWDALETRLRAWAHDLGR